MITSNSFFPKHPLWNPEEQLTLHATNHIDHEMGPWGSSLLPLQAYNSIDMGNLDHDNGRQIRRNQKQKQVRRAKCLKIAQGQECKAQTIDYIEEKTVFMRNANPILRRASHLPVISAREQYGDIFKYTKPIDQNLGSIQTLENSLTRKNKSESKNINVIEQIKLGRRKLSQKLQPKSLQKQRNNQSPVRIFQSLPSIEMYLKKRRNCFDIYEKCVIKKVTNMKEKQKSSRYQLL